MDRWNVDGYFKISSMPEGVFLTVYPPLGNGSRVSEEEIILEAKEKGILDIDYQAIKSAVKDNDATAVKIGESSKILLPTHMLLVEIAQDELSASLTILIPQESGQVITAKQVNDELKRNNVVYGLMPERITEALKKEIYNKVLIIAKGTEPINGQDAVIDFNFKREKSPPIFYEKRGRVDYKQYSQIVSVCEGDVLAVKTPATKGIPGMTVTGRTLPAKNGKDIPFLKGKNVGVSEDGLELRALASGKVFFAGSRISVDPIYSVSGDVDYKTGNIDFAGSLVIDGNVLEGFTVIASGDIEIKGTVEKAKIIAGGNISVASGVLGKREGMLKAGGDIKAKFVEYSLIEAQGDVIVSESILHSYVNARKRVVLNGRMGIILGGRVRAGQEVIAKVIGSWTEIPTIIEVGIDPMIREEIADLAKEIENDKKNFSELKLGIRTLQTLKQELGHLSSEKEELLRAHLEAQNFLMARLRDASERITALTRELSISGNGRVSVYNLVHPGVKISIKTATLVSREEYKFVTFTAKGSLIQMQPYEIKVKKAG